MNCDWQTCRLREIADVIDSRHKTPTYAEVGFPMVRVVDVKGGALSLIGTKKVQAEVYKDFSKGRDPKVGDLVITRVGSYGNVSYVSSNDKFCLGQNTALIVSNHADRYLYYVLTSPWLKRQIEQAVVGAVQKTISLESIKNLSIPMPSAHIRKKISTLLSSIDDKIVINAQINQTLEQMAQALFKSWFVDFDPVIDNALDAGNPIPEPLAERAARRQAMWAAGSESAPTRLPVETRRLFPDSFEQNEVLGWVPAGWESRKVLDLFELHRGFDLPTSKREHGSYPVFAAGGHHGTHSEFKMEPPGVITGRSGVIGSVYLSLEKYWPLNTSLYVRNYKVAGPYYAYHFLRRMDLGALNSGSAVPSLNRNYVHSSPALCPPVGLVVYFEKTVSCFFEKIALNNKQSESLSALRDTLLPKLLSGELQLPEAEVAVQTALEIEPA